MSSRDDRLYYQRRSAGHSAVHVSATARRVLAPATALGCLLGGAVIIRVGMSGTGLFALLLLGACLFSAGLIVLLLAAKEIWSRTALGHGAARRRSAHSSARTERRIARLHNARPKPHGSMAVPDNLLD